MQKQPEGYRQPCVFGDAVIVWNPLLEGPHARKLTFLERSQTAAPTIASIVSYLSGGILAPIHQRRQGLVIEQRKENALFYDDLYKRLFGRKPKHYDDDEAAALASELIQFCRSQLADVKCPRSVDFREELPRHPTGKLYKRLLKDEYENKAFGRERRNLTDA